ncbi:hypothetical protein Tco_0187399, partial [Tanacetum coccineum]
YLPQQGYPPQGYPTQQGYPPQQGYVVPFSSPIHAPNKPQPKKQEQPPVNNAPTIVVAAEPVASSAEFVQNGNHEEEGTLRSKVFRLGVAITY